MGPKQNLVFLPINLKTTTIFLLQTEHRSHKDRYYLLADIVAQHQYAYFYNAIHN
jgi:hypothetical protein